VGGPRGGTPWEEPLWGEPRGGPLAPRRADDPSGAYTNIRSVTSDGNPYARFRRALETGNETLITTAARELPKVALDDALRICLVLRGGDPDRYERAAVRWLGRFALEAREATIADLRLAAGALDSLPEHPDKAMELLQRLCVARGVA
jgi:hypothetical protein